MSEGVYDFIGLGFGPANLALAVALDEPGGGATPLRGRYFERRAKFAWHPDMLLPGARMQVSFLKDLATLRNPQSRFTFLSFIAEQGRLDEFINLEDFRPTRREFNAYLRWASDQLDGDVEYGREVFDVEPVRAADGTVERLAVRIGPTGGEPTEELLTRNVVVGTGGIPRIPAGVEARRGGRVFHSARFMARIADYPADQGPYRFAVVGDGQSAAEIFDYLITHYPDSRVTGATRGIAYRPMDDSPFVNEIFFPREVDRFYALPEKKRQRLLSALRNTNYAVVDLELIETLYRKVYDLKVEGRCHCDFLPFADLIFAEDREDGVRMRFQHWLDEDESELEADVLVLATGFDTPNPHPALSSLDPLLARHEGGRYRVDRDYRVETTEDFRPGVFLQGNCQETHGIADSLLSIVSVRAGDVVRGLRSQVAGPPAPAPPSPGTLTKAPS